MEGGGKGYMKVGGGGRQDISQVVLSLAMRAFDAEWHTRTKNLARFARLTRNFLLIKKLQIAYPFHGSLFWPSLKLNKRER